jgi:hypothetical protein
MASTSNNLSVNSVNNLTTIQPDLTTIQQNLKIDTQKELEIDIN